MEKLEYGFYYHIYNRGTNKKDIFIENNDYNHFLNLLSVFIEPVAYILSYAVMKNHFHILVHIKEENEIGYLNSSNSKIDDIYIKWKTYFPDINSDKLNYTIKPKPEKMFGHFFSTYAKGFNSKYLQTGSVFEHPFKRIKVENETYLKRLILYIHNNPVKHGFCEQIIEYPWTSYLSLISIKPTNLLRDYVIGWFDNKANFIEIHKTYKNDFEDIDDFC